MVGYWIFIMNLLSVKFGSFILLLLFLYIPGVASLLGLVCPPALFFYLCGRRPPCCNYTVILIRHLSHITQCLINNVDDIVVFLAWTVFNSNNFSLVSDKKKQRTGSTGEKKQKHWYLIHSWSDKACQGTVVNRARYYINGRSQAITFSPCKQYSVVL